MAKADTYTMESGGYSFKECGLCDKKGCYRAFYYPTYFNGDAEWLGDFCEDHKVTSPEKVESGEIKLKYSLKY